MDQVMPQVGDLAPWVENITNQHGEAVSLQDFAGQFVVLYFYPKDDTPGCTVEACGFRDHQEEIDAVVLGVSLDDAEAHRAFIEKHTLNFDLLVDPNGVLCQTYGVLPQDSEYPQRSTFLIDPDNFIAAVWPKVTPQGHWNVIRRAIVEASEV